MTAQKVITHSFYLLFFLTPLIWTPKNFELFEYNKMLFVYLMTVVITSSWVYRMLQEERIIFKRTILDIPLILFLLANILSTVFSIDQHISIWGYYSRSNGGLLSIISYLFLYWAYCSNMEKRDTLKVLISALSSAAIISLYAISEHFGVSPSCVILRGEFNVDCWIQRVQERVFATLGQPNWLAAYLGMLIFPALYFLLTIKDKSYRLIFYFLLFTLYMAFTFTYSRGGTFGLLAGLIIFVGLIAYQNQFWKLFIHKPFALSLKNSEMKPLLFILGIFLLINLLYGSALTRFQLDKLFTKSPVQQANQKSFNAPASIGTQLENGGTESGQIRFIVWKGAFDIFKHYPIFGSGVETFAYAYYQFRPVAHNLTSEWDFLYNKAHNEYINYLATTGIVGFLSYLAVIITFIYWCIKYYVSSIKGKAEETHNTHYLILIPTLLASYLSYLVQNLFGFSVVIIALFFYLFPALAFVYTDSITEFSLKSTFLDRIKRPLYLKSLKVVTIIIALLSILSVYNLWVADTIFAQGQKNSDSGNAGRAYNLLSEAVGINPREPFYRSELGYAAAQSAVALEDSDATLSAQLKKQSLEETENVLKSSPKNVSFWRSAIRTYYQLASIDPQFNQKTLETVEKTIALAPTDPKLYYNKAIILGQLDKTQEAINSLEKAIELKSNYREAFIALGLFHFDLASSKGKIVDQSKAKKAVEAMSVVLRLVPNDPEALNYLNEWGKQGVSTHSGEKQ